MQLATWRHLALCPAPPRPPPFSGLVLPLRPRQTRVGARVGNQKSAARQAGMGSGSLEKAHPLHRLNKLILAQRSALSNPLHWAISLPIPLPVPHHRAPSNGNAKLKEQFQKSEMILGWVTAAAVGSCRK